MAKRLNERDIDYIEAVKHYVRFVNCNPEAEDNDYLDAFFRIKILADKYIFNGYNEKDIEDILDAEDLQDLMKNFCHKLRNNLNIDFDENCVL